MNMLLETDMVSFFEMLKIIKECVDLCSENVQEYFDGFICDPDEVEQIAYEGLDNLPFCSDFDYLYYDDQDNIPVDERETCGEYWFFSDDNFIGYYKLLDELLKSKKISRKEVDFHKNEMDDIVYDCILERQRYSGVSYTIFSKKSRNAGAGIKVYLDYNIGYSLFYLYCGLIVLFDRYKSKLQQLKETYCGEKQMLEAA